MGIKYTSRYREALHIGPGHLAGDGRRIGATFGERRQRGKEVESQTQGTSRSAFQRLRNLFGLRTSGELPAANAQFVAESGKTPLQQMGEGRRGSAFTTDQALVAELDTIIKGKSKA
ncbi:MAG: hypothetical protein HYV02_03415 [Deltaproteobacteria bacterium]|nr:hypothetical protein [Deltaproteobacteria bacterium]